ncbi:hypothetical protein Q5752_005102 [Cryptotrichosporon argae]
MAPHATDLHRVYIQTLLARRAMPEPLALEMYKRAVRAVSEYDAEFVPAQRATPEGLVEFLSEITTLLEPLGMEIKNGAEETTGSRWVVLCNNSASDVGQLATDLSPLEIAYYREVLSEIIASYPANSIGSNAALKLTLRLASTMARSVAEALLGALVSRGWLSRSARGRYSLPPRAVLELDAYLREEFGADTGDVDEDDEPGLIKLCKRCGRIVLTGAACVAPDCGAHYHAHCHAFILGSRNPICPACKVDLQDTPAAPIGEAAVPRAEDGWAGGAWRRKRGRRSGAARNGAPHAGDGDDEEGDGDEGDELDSDGEAVESEEEDGPSGVSRRANGETFIPDSMPE